jgi:hypothetical protein
MNKNQRIVTTIAIIAIAVLCLASIVATAFVVNNFFGVSKEVAEVNNPEVKEPEVKEPEVKEPEVEEPAEKVIIIPASKEACGYDYEVMPRGRNEYGIPNADFGVDYSGLVEGPAIVQLDSLAAVSVFPGEVFEVPVGATTWKYTGDIGCLLSQYGEFPGKTIYRIDEISEYNPPEVEVPYISDLSCGDLATCEISNVPEGHFTIGITEDCTDQILFSEGEEINYENLVEIHTYKGKPANMELFILDQLQYITPCQ